MEIQVVVQMMVRVVMDEEMKKTRKLKFKNRSEKE